MSKFDQALQSLYEARGELQGRLLAIDDAIAAIVKLDAPAPLALPAPSRSPRQPREKSKTAPPAQVSRTPAARAERDAAIRKMVAEGATEKEIRAALGLRSPATVYMALKRLGLTLAARPKAAPPAPNDEADEIARFIAAKGVTRAVDFGAHQPIVDATRAMGRAILRAAHGKGWLVDGSLEPITTATLYERINAERKRRELPLIARPKDAA